MNYINNPTIKRLCVQFSTRGRGISQSLLYFILTLKYVWIGSKFDLRFMLHTNLATALVLRFWKIWPILTLFFSLITGPMNPAKKMKFSCQYCGLYCHSKGCLEDHIRTHTGEKPFSCSKCNKSFAKKANLKAHMIVHLAHSRWMRLPGQCRAVKTGKLFGLNYVEIE